MDKPGDTVIENIGDRENSWRMSFSKSDSNQVIP